MKWYPQPLPGEVTAQGKCEHLKAMDARYHTDKRSPLHHDNKCPIHCTKNEAWPICNHRDGRECENCR